MKKILFLFFSFIPALLFSQLTNVWKFGNGAGIDFNSGTPVALPASGMWALEGTGSVCDAGGNLLFYTNGNEVRDRNGNLMPNGSNLSGGTSATQCIVVPKPQDCGKYYIFHAQDHTGTGELRYSLVDMCLNNGLGDVVTSQKNIFLAQPASEKLTAVRNANGLDVWVITHQLSSAEFRVYPVTALGVGSPVNTTIGSVHAANCMIGPVKASHNGQKIVVEQTFCNSVEMFDFNTSTGVISNPVDLTSQLGLSGGYYGAEFSPDDQLLYLASTWVISYLNQVDLSTMTMTQLAMQNGNYIFGQLQVGPDGKIYMARGTQNYLDVINNPNTVGTGCNYQAAGFTLAAGTFSDMGLPNFITDLTDTSSVQTMPVSLGADTTLGCSFNPFVLNPGTFCGATYLWQDGSTTPTYTVTTAGTYSVQVTGLCGVGTATVNVNAGGSLQISTTQNPVSCGVGQSDGMATAYPSGTAPYTYSWSTSPVQTIAQATGLTPGIYTVTITDATGCTGTQTVNVTQSPPPAVNFMEQKNACNNYSFGPDIINPPGTYSWDFGDNQTGQGQNVVHTYGSAGTYTVTMTVDFGNGCISSVSYVLQTNDVNTALSPPNVFTPNGDGTNDEFIIGGLDDCTPYELKIYDRWGVLIFSTDTPYTDLWDGKSKKGKPVAEGVYYYIISTEFNSLSGFVTVLRGAE